MTTREEKLALGIVLGILIAFISWEVIGNYLDDQVVTSGIDITTDSATQDLNDVQTVIHVDYSLKKKYMDDPNTSSNIDTVVDIKAHEFAAHYTKDSIVQKLIIGKDNEYSLQNMISRQLYGEGITVHHVYVTEVSFK